MTYYGTLAALLFVFMNVWFVMSVWKKRNDVADVAWGMGFVMMAWASFLLSGQFSAPALLVNILVSVWGARLAWHIHARNSSKTEDERYAVWRRDWGAWFYPRSYVQVYLLQGCLLFCVALPVLIVNRSTEEGLGWYGLIGGTVWLIGFCCEVIGDRQLARFIKNPNNKGKLMQSGLWAVTRHPNYFGEVTLWWGVWLITLSAPHSVVGIIGPLTITFLILKVSGIPMLERKMAQHPDFAAYKKRVSVFFPLPPRVER